MSAEIPTLEEETNAGGLWEPLAGLFRKHFHSGRGGRAKLAITTSFVSRLVTTAASFVILPISVRYLGNEGYGLLATITSVVGWLQFTNMGIGLGLQNALTEETAKGDLRAQRELVSTAVFSLLGVGVALLAGGLLAFPYINWLKIFPPTSARFVTEIPWTVLVVFFGFVSTVVLGFLTPIYAARLELHISSIQAMVTSLLSLVATFVAVHFRWGLIGLTICTIGVTGALQWFFAAWTLFARGIRELRPSPLAMTLLAAGRIYKNGFNFLVLQICGIAFFQIDAFLISHFVSTNAVTPYNVAQKVFLQLSGLFAIVTGTLWGAYGNAKALGDMKWIRRTHNKVLAIFALFFVSLALVMVVAGHQLLAWWVGPASAPSTILIAAVVVYFSVREWNALHALLLNGLDIIRPQVWCLVITAILTLFFDLFLIRRLGVIGLPIGGFLAAIAISVWYYPYLKSKSLR